MVYRFVDENKEIFGLRWLIRKFKISMNSYYNYLKKRKETYSLKVKAIKEEIKSIYYNNSRILGHRGMKIFLGRKGIILSKTTVYKYMNKDLGLHAITKPKKNKYLKGVTHKVFKDSLSQNFSIASKNLAVVSPVGLPYTTSDIIVHLS